MCSLSETHVEVVVTQKQVLSSQKAMDSVVCNINVAHEFSSINMDQYDKMLMV